MRQAADLLRLLLEMIHEGRWSDLAPLYVQDAVVKLPFTPDGLQLEGRAAIDRHFQSAANAPFRISVMSSRIRALEDGDAVAEYAYELTRFDGRGTAFVDNVQTVRARDGLIVSSRDYHDHLRIASLARPDRK